MKREREGVFEVDILAVSDSEAVVEGDSGGLGVVVLVGEDFGFETDLDLRNSLTTAA